MKFIHCADLHLDSNLQTHLTSEQAHMRNLEILDTFENLVATAAMQKVTAIIIAGDLFDTCHVQPQTQARLLHLMHQYPQLDFIYLPGNHDERHAFTLIEKIPTNLKIFTEDWHGFRYGQVQITGKILDAKKTLNTTALRLQPNVVNIVVLHGDIHSKALELTKLQQQHIDYLALGHLHSYQKGQLDARGVYVYSGCLEGRGFDECGEKGYVLLEVNPERRTVKSQFIPFAKRQLMALDVVISDCKNWFAVEKRVLDSTKTIATKNLLKITLQGTYNLQMDKQLDMLAQKLRNFYVVKICDQSVLDWHSLNLTSEVSLRNEFIRLVQAANLSLPEKEQIILYGIKALNGVKLS